MCAKFVREVSEDDERPIDVPSVVFHHARREKGMPLTRKELDEVGCQDPKCDHSTDGEMFLHSRCHVEADLQVAYDRRAGVLNCYCGACDELLVSIAVARSSEGTPA